MKIIAVIPARFASTRFPGKPLALLQGHPIIWWVVRRARDVEGIQDIYVATDNWDIANAARDAGAQPLMPVGEFASGTDRIAAAIHEIKADVVVNIQGDEPMIERETIRRTLNAVLADQQTHVGSACVKIFDQSDYLSPNVVKVVRDRFDYALYFSRSPIPNLARAPQGGLVNYGRSCEGEPALFYGWKHIGLYIYRRHVLDEFVALSPTLLEDTEKLEQMRLLENGYRIKVVETPFDSQGVDTPEDLAELNARLTPAQ
ncbi:MAG: 3-deoxy-manno-octulosonate cytidylyltransferase [Candidatus Sumerlaeia bacterium]